MSRTRLAVLCLTTLLISGARAQSSKPELHEDTAWPKALPNDWKMGAMSGVAVDSHDNVWVLHRPSTLANLEKGAAVPPVAASPVLEFDSKGNLLKAWGGKSTKYEWVSLEHGLTVDHQDNVWVSGTGRNGLGKIMKFKADGTFLFEIGRQDEGLKATNNDPSTFGTLPADMFVDAKTNELFVADGERGSRRLVVYDAADGKFKRLWGAYGEKPDEGTAARYDPSAPLSKTFSNAVHCVEIGKDDLVYVCDRGNNRLQIFRKDGTFVKEGIVEKQTAGAGSTADIAFSPDQKWLFVGDGINQKVWILDGTSLAMEGVLQVGQNIHAIAMDSKGNLFVGSTAGRRLQKFIP